MNRWRWFLPMWLVPLALMAWSTLQNHRGEYPMATLSYWLAVAALLVGPACWLKLRLDAWRARRSQDFLHEHLASSWQALGRWLSAYVGLLVMSLGCGLLYELHWGWNHLKDGGWTILIFGIPVVSGLLIGARLVQRLRQRWQALGEPGSSFLGRRLTREQMPQVWRWVEALAERVGAPGPEHIVVGIDQSFFVTSVPVLLQPSGEQLSGRTLYLPLTYLSSMSQAESAAIIGHELGHFRHQDTERSSEVSAQFRLMSVHFASLLDDDGHPPGWFERPVMWLAGEFLHHFQVAVHHWRRDQELLADRAGAEVAGERLFCQALLRVIALDRVIDQLLGEGRQGNLVQALSEHLRHTPPSLDQSLMTQALAHPFDTHPPTQQRLVALDIALDEPLLAEATRQPTDADRQWFAQLTGTWQPAEDTPRHGAPA